MNCKSVLIGVAAVFFTVLGGFAVSAQDSGQGKYTVKVPGGLAFSEFKDTKPGRRSPSVTTPRWSR
jgi:hypothetical protein